MPRTGNSSAVLTAFSRGEISPMKTPNNSLSFNRIDENGNNNYDLIVLKSYDTVIAYRWIGSDIIYYRPYIKKHPNGNKLSNEELLHYQYKSNTTSHHLSKLFEYINNEVENNNREFIWMFDKVENNEYEYLNH
jgi:hypothetical protein